MIGGDPGGKVGLKIRAAQTAGVAFDQLAAVETGLDNLLHPLAAVQHAVHVHHFGDAANFRPGQHGFHLRAGKIGAGHLQSRRRRHAGRRRDHHLQRQMAAGGDGVAHAFDAQHVGQLVRVPEYRRGALSQHDFGIAFRRQVGAFKVDVRIHQPRRQEISRQRAAFVGIGAAAARVHAGDGFADDPDVGLADLSGGHVDDLRVG